MERTPQRDLFPGALEMIVLQILRCEPMHGYALAQVIKRNSGDLLEIEEGSLYPALQRMLKAGWLSSEWGFRRETGVCESTKLPRRVVNNSNGRYRASTAC